MNTSITEKYKSGRKEDEEYYKLGRKWEIWDLLHLKVKLSLYKLTREEENRLYRRPKGYQII